MEAMEEILKDCLLHKIYFDGHKYCYIDNLYFNLEIGGTRGWLGCITEWGNVSLVYLKRKVEQEDSSGCDKCNPSTSRVLDFIKEHLDDELNKQLYIDLVNKIPEYVI